MGHCKHQWQERTEVLREVFVSGERAKHVFYVCARCMRIDEVLPAPARLERPLSAELAPLKRLPGDEVAA